MKRILLSVLILCFLSILSFAQWVDTGGSTWTATTESAQQEIKDIQNDIHDHTNSAWTVKGNVWISSGVITTIEQLNQGNIWITSGVVTTVEQLNQGNVWITSGVVTSVGQLDQGNVWITSGVITRVQAVTQLDQGTVWITSGVVTNVNQVDQGNIWITSGVITRVQAVTQLDGGTVWITSGVITNVNQLDQGNIWITSGVVTKVEEIGQVNQANVWITSGVITTVQTVQQLNQGNVWITSGVVTSIGQVNQGNVWVTSGTITIGNFPVDYPDSTAQASLSSIDGNITKCDTDDVSDARYYNKVSTGTAGRINASGNIAISDYSMEAYVFYSDGGDSQIESTWHDGIIWALDGIPVRTEKLSVPISNPTFQCTLPAGTSLYYILHGVK